MTERTGTILHEWFEQVWNQGRLDAIDRLAAPDHVAHGLADVGVTVPHGRDALKQFVQRFRSAFPDIRIQVEHALVDGDMVVARCSVTATHTGPGIEMAATGKPIAMTGMCMVRVKDGMISEGWNNFDFLGLYRQLGLT